ncbi:hypothetical protein H4R18_005012 [Coemansia javaensis]|uniref:Zn(2)-C6 fungal-type domain-containing protein n=1 Tax=Coemansia javaensis TaxID=2761396 RepID=A0A9W8LE01_9FUNG|nr:hypothetical protein H4R18_005012 [Coemansia javaensis]
MFSVPYLTSCNHCRDKKRKCNGERPACSLCRAHNVPCEYRRSRRFRKRTQDAGLGAQIGAGPVHPILPAPRPIAAGPPPPPPPPPPAGSASPRGTATALPERSRVYMAPPPSEALALSQLLAGDMFPQTQQLPQPILQGVNTFMSPFSGACSQAIPEWISQQKPEAAIISNLESIASAYNAPLPGPLLAPPASDGALLGGLASQLVPGADVLQSFPLGSQSLSAQQFPPAALPAMLPAMSAPPPSYAAPPSYATPTSYATPLPYGAPQFAQPPQPQPQPQSQPRGGPSDAIGPYSPAKSETLPQGQSPAQQPHTAIPDDFVPEVIREYASEFPAALSPQVLLKVMRGICGSTRTSLINVDLELAWCMILKGIIPRILLFAYIASMARGQAIDPDLMPLLPAKFDELCYEVAAKDIPRAVASPCLWSALSLHLIGRYEFQSARYDLMMQHYEMAFDVLTRTAFHGFRFPWSDVPDQLKRTFEYDYYVYTFWVGFQWHIVSSLNLDRPFNIDIDSQPLPVPAGEHGYFTPDLPCGFDLLTLLPASCLPRTARARGVGRVWFSGFDDPEYAGWRPAAWREIKPNYRITAALQRMIPLGAQMYRLQRSFSDGRLALDDYLQRLHAQQELMKRWLYSLPAEFELTSARAAQISQWDAARQPSSEIRNLVMEFKELTMMYAVYSTFLIRANRVALLGMLGEDVAAPATAMDMRVFGLRDYLDAPEQSIGKRSPEDSGSNGGGGGGYSRWQRNLAFHKCRMNCYESIDILCDVVRLSFVLHLDLFTYGTSYVAVAGELLNVLIGQLGVEDRHVKWKTKTRLGHVLCLLRSLQHWAPALYLFVYGIQALSDPSLVLEPDEAPGEAPARRNGKAGGDWKMPHASSPGFQQRTPSVRDAGAPEMPNPFQPNHIINHIVDDLDVSLATFIAPAYPVLLLKIFASNTASGM